LPTTPLGKVVSHLRGLLQAPGEAAQTDSDLLDRFLTRHDESAFEVLVRRHGPMVLGVCRRVLGDGPDAEDAFQATFLVLVRRGDSIRPRGQVGNWLYGVAHRTALEARRAASRRRRKEAQAMPRSQPGDDVWSELRPLLDQELSRLPDRYRIPVVLCDLEGMTRKEAASHLGWAEGTVSSRLSRGRELLARRLKRHSLSLSLAALTAVLTERAMPAPVAAPLIGSTVQVAVLTVAGQTATAMLIASNAVALMETMVRAMTMQKIKFVAAIVLGLGLLGGLAYQGVAGQTAERAAPPAVQPAPPDQPIARPVSRTAVAVLPGDKAADDDKKVSVKELPAVVVRTVPQAGDTRVDAEKVTEIRVIFSKDMMDKSWSWSQLSDETFPKVAGEVRYEKDRRTCVLPVKLQPGKTYALWLNSENFGNFKDASGQSAVPYLLVFETKPAK
jgi:RNA polymerase sigma-70 factor (ECF subfamily)